MPKPTKIAAKDLGPGHMIRIKGVWCQVLGVRNGLGDGSTTSIWVKNHPDRGWCHIRRKFSTPITVMG